MGSVFSDIGNGISSIFGGGSDNRQQTNDQNSSGNALGNANQAVGNAGNYFNTAGTTLGGAQGALGNQQGALQGETADGFQQTGLAGTAAQTYYQNYGNAINAMLGADGFSPSGGMHSGALQAGGGGSGTTGSSGGMTYNPNFNPYQATGNSLIGQYSDSVAPAYQNAVNAAQHDDLSRGITGANTIGPGQDAQIRQAQASDVANFGRNLGVQAQQEQYSRLGNAINLIQGAGQTAQQGYGSAGQTYGNVAQGYGSNASGFGNVAGDYGNVGQDYLNQAQGYGQVSTGYQNGANQYAQASQNQQNNLLGLAGLFGG